MANKYRKISYKDGSVVVFEKSYGRICLCSTKAEADIVLKALNNMEVLKTAATQLIQAIDKNTSSDLWDARLHESIDSVILNSCTVSSDVNTEAQVYSGITKELSFLETILKLL
jgi:hypothetical protein